jgi:hypothetical protein
MEDRVSNKRTEKEQERNPRRDPNQDADCLLVHRCTGHRITRIGLGTVIHLRAFRVNQNPQEPRRTLNSIGDDKIRIRGDHVQSR